MNTGLLFAVIAAVFFLPCMGQTFYVPGTDIYWLRFHRTLLAVIAGGGLSLAGLVFQAMFRNPLATPYTLGIASGAAFGAAVCLQTSLRLGLPVFIASVPTVSFGAFCGALLTMGIVSLLSRSRDASSEKMLLAGVAVNFFFSSMIILLQYLSAPHDAFQILRWTMGGVQNGAAADNIRLAPVILLLTLFLYVHARTLNVFATGNNRAASLGVDVFRFRVMMFLAVSLAVGAAVSVTGPIGFVGLIIPHIARLLRGPDHRTLIFSTGLSGGLFLAVCDTFGRSVFYPAELPVGIITSLLGGPFFLWLLIRKENRRNH